jgi:hypothetical protein
MISMADQNGNRFERRVRLDDDTHSIMVEAGGELEPRELELSILTSRIAEVVTLNRDEAREVAYHLITATPWMYEVGELDRMEG